MKKLFSSIKEGEAWFKEKFGDGETFDAEARTVHLWEMPSLILFINGLVDGDVLTKLLTEMQGNQLRKNEESDGDDDEDDDKFLAFFPYHSVTAVEDKDELLTSLLSGIVGFITPSGYAFTIDVRSYRGRQPGPITKK